MEFHFSNKHVGQVKVKNFIRGLNEQTFDLKKPGTGLPELPKISAYPQKCVPININKINDLKKVEAYIPLYLQTLLVNFIKKIITGQLSIWMKLNCFKKQCLENVYILFKK